MEQKIFNAMELDAIGEIMNISLGSSATAVSNLLDHRVDITTPSVSVVPVEEFSLGDLEPAIAVEIKYVSGLEGSNIMLLKRSDVKVIVDILMGSEMPEEEFELNDLTISAVCEVMNQMMGAASTALSDFLGRPVNISTPQSYTLDDLQSFKSEHFHNDQGLLVVVRFMLKIENILNSEFVNVMSVDLARELLLGFGMDVGALDDTGAQAHSQPAQEASAPAAEPAPAAEGGGGKLSQEEIERLMGGMAQPSQPAPAPAAESGGGKLSQEEIERLMGGMTQPSQPAPEPVPQAQPTAAQPQYAPPQPQYAPVQPQYIQAPVMQQTYQPEPKVINTRPLELPTLDVAKEIGEEQAQNLELIMSVPLEVSVEIGRTRRKVEDILTFSKGSLVVLDKLAGDQVDLFVNGLCVARGDVVVVDDNFGVRITEVLKQPKLLDMAKKN
ncbi:flagellar motor switch protein FliN [Intestinimonas aquisgranensis]|nr:flagellar motor switch protein FliN [Intestinimonas aquisgranensis]